MSGIAVTPMRAVTVCLPGVLVAPGCAQVAVAELQRVEAADVDPFPERPGERRVRLSRSAYLLSLSRWTRVGTTRRSSTSSSPAVSRPWPVSGLPATGRGQLGRPEPSGVVSVSVEASLDRDRSPRPLISAGLRDARAHQRPACRWPRLSPPRGILLNRTISRRVDPVRR